MAKAPYMTPPGGGIHLHMLLFKRDSDQAPRNLDFRPKPVPDPLCRNIKLLLNGEAMWGGGGRADEHCQGRSEHGLEKIGQLMIEASFYL
jgi:hypothetical protein